jgi:hypothetical protein
VTRLSGLRVLASYRHHSSLQIQVAPTQLQQFATPQSGFNSSPGTLGSKETEHGEQQAGGDPRNDVVRAGELHHPRSVHLTELHEYLLGVLQQGALKEAQPEDSS